MKFEKITDNVSYVFTSRMLDFYFDEFKPKDKSKLQYLQQVAGRERMLKFFDKFTIGEIESILGHDQLLLAETLKKGEYWRLIKMI